MNARKYGEGKTPVRTLRAENHEWGQFGKNTKRDGADRTTDFSGKARVYYGDVSLHEYLERTTWHSAQHVRQLVMVLGTLGIEPDRPPASEAFAGLPMPEKVWDDEPLQS